MKKIEDEFGKKIGGSKRDLWKMRGLCLSDLEDMNEMERSKYVKKDNVWPKPDYELMKQEKDIRIIYFYKKIRDSFSAKPYEGEEESYIQILSEFRKSAEEMQSDSDIVSFFDKHIEGYATKSGYCWSLTPEFSKVGGNKVFKTIANVSLHGLDREIKKKQFLYTEDEKILSNYNIYPKSMFTLDESHCDENSIWLSIPGSGFRVDKCTMEEYMQIPNDYCIVLLHNYTFVSAFENAELAKKALLEAAKRTLVMDKETKTTKSKRKKKFIPVQFRKLDRIGEDVLRGRNMTGEDYLYTFHFRGGEFGNYMSKRDRQCSLNFGFEAFHDLAVGLDISDDEIGINDALSIAFGARGSGDASAHFEPLSSVINLTKMRGAGSLAHEYGHALDFMLSMQSGNKDAYTEQYRKDMPDSVKHLIDVMKFKEVEVEESLEKYEAAAKQSAKQASYLLKNEFRKSNDGMQKAEDYLVNLLKVTNIVAFAKEKNVDPGEKYFHYALARKCVEELSELKRLYVPRAKKLSKGSEDSLVFLISSIFESISHTEPTKVRKRIPTDFKAGSNYFDTHFSKTSNGYWSCNVEMFARAFACYVKDKLEEKGMKNDYLCGHADCFSIPDENGKLVRAYPYGAERKEINKAIDAVMDDFRKILQNKDLAAAM